MNGRVVAVLVKPGEQVAAGQPVMTLEAMKMEHVHTAGVAGTVSSIDVAEGEQVTTGRIVVEIAAARSHRRVGKERSRAHHHLEQAVRRWARALPALRTTFCS